MRNCDGDGPHSGEEVRVLPLAIGYSRVCPPCLERANAQRRVWNARPGCEDDTPYDTPAWEALRVWDEGDEVTT